MMRSTAIKLAITLVTVLVAGTLLVTNPTSNHLQSSSSTGTTATTSSSTELSSASVPVFSSSSPTISSESSATTNASTTSSSEGAITTFLSNGDQEIINLTYCDIANQPEQMDVYCPSGVTPNDNTSSVYPLVLYVNGGAWIISSNTVNWLDMFPLLTSTGYIVASMNYAMPPPSPSFPSNIEDVACAVRFLRFDAARLHID